MKVAAAVLLLLSGSSIGHAAGVKGAMPPPEDESLRGLQSNFTIPDANGTIAEGKEGNDDPFSPCCNGKIKEKVQLILKLTPRNCNEGSYPKYDSKFECTQQGGFSVSDALYRVKVLYGGVLSGGTQVLAPGQPFTITDIDSNSVEIQVKDNGGAGKVQKFEIHTSCSKLITIEGAPDPKDKFGSATLIGYEYEDGVYFDPTCVPPSEAPSDAPSGAPTPSPSASPSATPSSAPSAVPSESPTFFPCQNTKKGGRKDERCTDECPLCAKIVSGITVPFDDDNPADDGEFGQVCKTCLNDKTGGAQDSGCPIESPICIANQGDFGDVCTTCFNDNTISDEPDSGCSPETPVCESTQGQYGFECLVCKITSNPNDIDLGCSPNAPMCNGGSGCFKCKDTTVGGTDRGCPSGYPVCVAVGPDGNGNFGDECATCINNKKNGANDPDTGCPSAFPVCFGHYWEGGKFCAKCVNDNPNPLAQDSGCPSNKKICGADLGEPGDKCFKCVNDNPNPFVQDSGCPSNKKICGADLGELGDECFECINDKPAPTAQDGGCSPVKKFCGVPTGNDIGNEVFGEYGKCFECRKDGSGNVIGCAGPDQLCVDASDNEVANGKLGTCFTVPCNEMQEAGGQGTTVRFISLGQPSGTFGVTYEMFTIMDSMDIEYEGNNIYSTNGLVSGGPTPDPTNVPYSGLSSTIKVTIVGPNPSTAWEYTIFCPNSPAGIAPGANPDVDECTSCKLICKDVGCDEDVECGPSCA